MSDTVGQEPKEKQPHDALGRFDQKFSPEKTAQIVDALRGGAPPEMACAYAGVVRQTYYNWLKRGRDAIANANGDLPEVVADDAYARFAIECDNALAHFAVGNLTSIGLHSRTDREGTWQASAWLLERRFPALFGRRTRTEITGRGGGPIQVENAIVLAPGALDRLPLERKLQLAEILAEMDSEVIESEPLLELEA